jgi:hypothetical protein
MKALSIHIEERPDLVVSFEKTILNTYRVVKGEAGITISNILFAPLRFIAGFISVFAKIITSIIAFILLAILLDVLFICLCYGNLLFYLMKDQIIEASKSLSRKSIINKHLKIENALRHLKSLRKSRILFSLPIMGSLNLTFLNNLIFFEAEIKKIAYPDINTIPDGIPIHKYDTNDPWQDDLQEYGQDQA